MSRIANSIYLMIKPVWEVDMWYVSLVLSFSSILFWATCPNTFLLWMQIYQWDKIWFKSTTTISQQWRPSHLWMKVADLWVRVMTILSEFGNMEFLYRSGILLIQACTVFQQLPYIPTISTSAVNQWTIRLFTYPARDKFQQNRKKIFKVRILSHRQLVVSRIQFMKFICEHKTTRFWHKVGSSSGTHSCKEAHSNLYEPLAQGNMNCLEKHLDCWLDNTSPDLYMVQGCNSYNTGTNILHEYYRAILFWILRILRRQLWALCN